MIVNVYCTDKGWLFNDLKREIALCGAIPSEKPIANADAYICIRSSELSSPPNKTVVQIHDVKGRAPECAHLSFVHPYQKSLYDGESYYTIDPIGSRPVNVVDTGKNAVIGFFCREIGDLKGSRFFKKGVELARKNCNFTVLMIGERLEHIANLGIYEKRPAEPKDYERITSFVTCSESPMIPLSAYEALAAGREVISTPRQWIGGITNVRVVYTPYDLAQAIESATNYIRSYTPIKPYCRNEWAKTQYQYAVDLCG